MNSRELRFLRLVAERSGELGWYGVEQRLAGVEPFKPGAPELQRRLAHLGLTTGTDRYAITDRGRAVLADIDANGWLLGPAEASDLAAQLAAPIEQRIQALGTFLEQPMLFPKVARQLHAAGLALEIIAWCTQLVVAENRSAVAFEFVTHADEAVRRALFLAWGGPGEGAGAEPARFKAPGPPYDWASDPMFVDLLNVGLNDASHGVRDAAARLVYLTQSGAHVANDLLGNLASPSPSPWSAAALGSARDERSLAALRALLAHDDERVAAMAVRGLAARPDGRADLLAALRDPRRSVQWNAEVSLGEIATGLTDDELAAFEALPNTRTALAYYRARNR